MEAGTRDELGSLKLHYDLTEIKSSPYYAEASEYIRMDLPPSIIRPEELEKLITEFNNDVDEFMINVILLGHMIFCKWQRQFRMLKRVTFHKTIRYRLKT